MDALDAIQKRRSVRKYTPDPVSDADVETVLDAARWAPSWANTQCVRWIVVRDAATVTLDELQQMCADNLARFKVPKYVLAIDVDDFLAGKRTFEILFEPEKVEIAAKSVTVDRIDQSVLHVDKAAKRDRLVELLSAPDFASIPYAEPASRLSIARASAISGRVHWMLFFRLAGVTSPLRSICSSPGLPEE